MPAARPSSPSTRSMALATPNTAAEPAFTRSRVRHEAGAELLDLGPHGRQLGLVLAPTEDAVDQASDRRHLGLGHALRGRRRRADAQTARDVRRPWIVRH